MAIEFHKFIEEHEKRFINKITPPLEKPTRLFGQNGLVLTQSLLRRSHALTLATISNVREKNLVSMALSVRAHIETSALLGSFLKKLTYFYENKIDAQELDRFIKASLLGSRTLTFGVPSIVPQPVQVLTAIDHSDTILKASKISKTALRDMYDSLSELCHPNFLWIYRQFYFSTSMTKLLVA